MLKIRLARYGARNDPVYRIVAIEKSLKNKGKPLAILGHFHPAKDEVKIDQKKVDAWLKKGAVASLAVRDLLKKK